MRSHQWEVPRTSVTPDDSLPFAFSEARAERASPDTSERFRCRATSVTVIPMLAARC
jgi:hypothetical protein